MQVGVGPQQPLNLVRLLEADGLDVQMNLEVGDVAMQPSKTNSSIYSGSAQSSVYFGDHQACDTPQGLGSRGIRHATCFTATVFCQQW